MKVNIKCRQLKPKYYNAASMHKMESKDHKSLDCGEKEAIFQMKIIQAGSDLSYDFIALCQEATNLDVSGVPG